MILTFLLTIVSIAGWADDYTYGYLVFTTNDGKEQSFAVEDLTLTFSDGKLVASNGTTTQTFSLADLAKMFFSENATDGIETLKVDGEVEVFTVSGIRMGQYASIADARRVLPQGKYIFKQGSKTNKIAIK